MKRLILIMAACLPVMGLLAAEVEPISADTIITLEKKRIEVKDNGDLTGFNWSKVPVVLVEMGFMSNPEEDQKMAETSYQEKMMKSVAEGAQAYFENK